MKCYRVKYHFHNYSPFIGHHFYLVDAESEIEARKQTINRAYDPVIIDNVECLDE